MRTLLALAMLAVAQPALAQDLPVELRVPAGPVKVGDEIEIEVLTGAPWTILGMQLDLNYDPSILEPAAPAPWTPGDIWTGSLFEASNLETETGHIQYASIDLSYDWAREAGVIARARFRVVGAGTCAFTFGAPGDPDYNFPVFLNELNEVVPVLVTMGTLTVSDEDPPPPPPPPVEEDPAPTATASGGGGSGGGGGGCSAGAETGGASALMLALLILAGALLRR